MKNKEMEGCHNHLSVFNLEYWVWQGGLGRIIFWGDLFGLLWGGNRISFG
jgi:hypothetical protein